MKYKFEYKYKINLILFNNMIFIFDNNNQKINIQI